MGLWRSMGGDAMATGQEALFVDLGRDVPRWRYVLSFPLIIVAGFGIGVGGLLALEHGGIVDAGTLAVLFSSPVEGEGHPILRPVLQFVVLMWGIIAFLAAVLVVVPLIHNQSWRSLIHTGPRVHWAGFRTSLAAAFCIPLAGVLWGWAEGEVVLNPDLDLRIWGLLVVLSVVLVPLQVLAEEVFFRGYLLQAVARFTRRVSLRWLLPALAFAALHFANTEVVVGGAGVMALFLLLALYLGGLALLGNGLELPVGFHLGNNLVAILILGTENSSLDTPTLFLDTQLDWSEISLMPALFVFAAHAVWVWGWMRWRYRWRPAWQALRGRPEGGTIRLI